MTCQNKGQTVVEIALFATVIILVMGTLLSYIQSQNDRQYAQMEAFRRALYQACTFLPESGEGAGAGVQYTLLQNRRYVDATGRKSGSQLASGSASVYWAVPEVDEDVEPDSKIIYRVNDTQQDWDYRSFVPKEMDEDRSFKGEDIDTSSTLSVNERLAKNEDRSGITSTKSYNINETVNFTIPYSIVDEDDNAIKSGTLWTLSQTFNESGGHSWRTEH